MTKKIPKKKTPSKIAPGTLLTTNEAAVELGVSQNRILHMIYYGRIPAKKFGRDWVIKIEDLEPVRVRRPGPLPADGSRGTSLRKAGGD